MQLNFPTYNFKVKKVENRNYIFDIIRKKYVLLTPEEWVRQHLVHYLVNHCGCTPSLMAVEKGLTVNGLQKRFDVLVYDEQTQPWMMVECKSMDVKLDGSTLMQILSYHLVIPVEFLVITNGIECHVAQKKNGTAEWVPFFPKYLVS